MELSNETEMREFQVDCLWEWRHEYRRIYLCRGRGRKQAIRIDAANKMVMVMVIQPDARVTDVLRFWWACANPLPYLEWRPWWGRRRVLECLFLSSWCMVFLTMRQSKMFCSWRWRPHLLVGPSSPFRSLAGSRLLLAEFISSWLFHRPPGRTLYG